MTTGAILTMLALFFAGLTLAITVGLVVMGMLARRRVAAGSPAEASILGRRAGTLHKVAVVLLALILVLILIW